MEAGNENELRARLDALRRELAGSASREHEGQMEAEHPEWSETLALVHRAGDAFVASAQRTRELEAKLSELSEAASRALERLEAQVQDVQQQLASSETRRMSAEEGLTRLCAAIREHFSGPTAATEEPASQAPAPALSAQAS